MSSQDQTQSGDSREERFQNPELGSGVRDTGTDAPEPGKAGSPPGGHCGRRPLTRRSAIRPRWMFTAGKRPSCPRKTPAPRSRRMRVQNARRNERTLKHPGSRRCKRRRRDRPQSRIPTTSRRPRRPRVVVQRSLRPTSNRRRRHRSRTVTMTGSGLRTLQAPGAASPRANLQLTPGDGGDAVPPWFQRTGATSEAITSTARSQTRCRPTASASASVNDLPTPSATNTPGASSSIPAAATG